MHIIYPDKFASLEDSALLQQATEILKRTVGTTSSGLAAIGDTSNITATWKLQERSGRPVYTLTLSDSVSEVSAEFLPSDLRNAGQPRLLTHRMAWLWGDLLEKQSHKQLEELMKLRA